MICIYMNKQKHIRCCNCKKLLEQLSMDELNIWEVYKDNLELYREDRKKAVEPCCFCGIPLCLNCEHEHVSVCLSWTNHYWNTEINSWKLIWE